MSERTIKRSVWSGLLAAFGIAAAVSYRNVEAQRILDSDKKGKKFRNNYAQKVGAKVRKVRRWRKRNRISSVSRAYNLKHR